MASRVLANDKKLSFDPANNVNTVPFRCIVPQWSCKEHEVFQEGELDRFFDPDPNDTIIVNLTIADMVDHLNTNVMFEICENEDVIVVMRYICKYIAMVESLVASKKNTPDEIANVIAQCKRFRGELARILKRTNPELYLDGTKKKTADDLFSEFGG